MIHHFVQFALRQRFLVLMLVVLVVVAGALSFQRMPVDAYPDLSPPMVEVITQWPGHAAEEIERLVTLPIEVEMNGVPHMEVMRSISLYGLSDVSMTFQESTDDYFARQVVFERLSDVPAAVGRDAEPVAAVQSVRARLSLRDRKPGSQPAGTENDRRLGHRAGLQIGAGRGGRFRLRRHGDAVSGAARSRRRFTTITFPCRR